jgi:DNA-binding CsgD family transcriptional regulator
MHNRALVSAHAENAELAVENERTRFARDLHGILGHSLTVITVKAELAQRLPDVDPEGTRRELSDLERLSRDALGDVRRAVEGYRELTLPGELARARIALAAATESLFAGESPLTARETDVLQAARGGAAISAVARALFLSEGTVRNHLSSAIGKTGAADRAEAVTIAEGNGWLWRRCGRRAVASGRDLGRAVRRVIPRAPRRRTREAGRCTGTHPVRTRPRSCRPLRVPASAGRQDPGAGSADR